MPAMMRPFIPSLALLLAGCAGTATSGGYPSLAKRPFESANPAAPSVAASAAPQDPALDAEVERLRAQVKAGADGFDRAYPKAEALAHAAASSAVSSEAWVAAQGAVSELEAARNDAVSALAALDTLYAARVDAIAAGTATGGAETIDTARGAALAVIDSQNDRLDALKAMLPQA
jgi:hypothetical protein